MITIQKLKVLVSAVMGYLNKWMIDAKLLSVPSLRDGCDIVVSLTSYGRRVANNVVYYTLVSLLRQKVQPARIILWLAEEEWNDETLPTRLKSIRDKGVEIRYCKDIRSYKKLIPTLELCPGANIMTVDDDMIYSSDMVGNVWSEHQKHPDAIICRNASMPLFSDGVPRFYEQWKGLSQPSEGRVLFPVGVGGTLYPAGSLHADITDSDLFMKLCPLADDIWFWFCGLRKGSMKRYISGLADDLSFDALYQYFHKGSALTHTNRFEHANDKQFRDLFEQYGVKVGEENKLKSN